MRYFILALSLLFAVPTLAAEPNVCKPGPDLRPCKPPAVKVNGRCTIVKETVKEVAAPCPPAVVPAPVIITKEVIKEVPVEVVKLVTVEKESEWENMVFARFGAHWNTNGYPSNYPTQTQLNAYPFANWGSWDVGTEFHYKPWRLGLRSGVGNNGISGLLQVFIIQGPKLNWYAGAGAAYTQYPFYRPTVPYVQRYWDVQVATGVEYAFTKNIIGLADLRASVPIPWTNTARLTNNDFGSALSQTALLVGVGYRF